MSDKNSLAPSVLLEGLYDILKNNGDRVDECGCSETDEDISMFSREKLGKRGGRGQSDNPWNQLKKQGRSFKKRVKTDEAEIDENRSSATYTVKDAKHILAKLGFGPTGRQKGSHDVWKDKNGILFTIPVHGKELEYGMSKNLNRIVRDRGLHESFIQECLSVFHLEEALSDMQQSLVESGKHSLSDTAKASVKGAITTPDANNNAGDAYKSWRFGLALAGAPEYPSKATNDIGGDPLITTYTDEERKMVQYAAHHANVGHLKNITSNKSEEKSDVNKTSVITPAKRNKYGV